MSSPDRPKRPSARPADRRERPQRADLPQTVVPSAVPSSPPPATEPTPGKAAPRAPRVSARRSASAESTGVTARPAAPSGVEPGTPAATRNALDAERAPTRGAGSLHDAKTVVPKQGKPPRAPKANKASGKALRPEQRAAGSNEAEGAVDAPAPTPVAGAASAAERGKLTAPTERPNKSRARRPSQPEAAVSDAPPGVEPVEAVDTWNADVPSAALGAAAGEESHETRLLRRGPHDAAHVEAERSAAQSILASDYYARQYGAHGLRALAADVDEFGFDPYVEERAQKPLELLVQRYFRAEIDGAGRVPSEGRALFVVNRAGVLPWDALVLRTMLRLKRPELPPLRWLAEDDVIHYPFLGVFMNRLGAVRACPENAERLLTHDRLVAVFPEGAQGSSKPYDERYRLQRFGRGGYIRLALKLGVPIYPTAIVGSEDVHPLLGRSRLLGKLFGMGSVPVTPTFPWLGALGLVPAPVKWRVVVGEPVDLGAYGPKAADDALVVHRLNEQVRGILQNLVDTARAQRGHALFG
jgi:1-acyl-sn-glycerol-3-phosphate acyltransferase